MLGYSSPWLYRFIFAALCGVLLAAHRWVAAGVTGVIALLLALVWYRYGEQHRRDSRDSIY
jgi:predicted membrane channel-forming protein YqfA (hemolysin III family)